MNSPTSITKISCYQKVDSELQKPLMIFTGITDWYYWSYYCEITQREIILANYIRNLLESLQLIPNKYDSTSLLSIKSPKIIDIGCGTMEFTNALNIPDILGMDITDFRKHKNSLFIHGKLEDIINGTIHLPSEYRNPDIVIFKQSFHLISNNHSLIQTLFPNSHILILQASCCPWNCQPYNGKGENAQINKTILEQNGRKVDLYRTELHYSFSTEQVERFLIGGFQSDIRKLSLKERLKLYEDVLINTQQNNNADAVSSNIIPFYDIIDVLLAYPCTEGSTNKQEFPVVVEDPNDHHQ